MNMEKKVWNDTCQTIRVSSAEENDILRGGGNSKLSSSAQCISSNLYRNPQYLCMTQV